MSTYVVDPIPKCTYIYQQYPDTNYGSSAVLSAWTDSSGGKGTYHSSALVEANISAIIGQTVDASSKLELYINDFVRYPNPDGVGFARLTTAWDENVVTWNAPPGWTGVLFYYPEPSATGWYTVTGAGLAAFLQDALDSRAGVASLQIADYVYSNDTSGFDSASDDDTNSPSRKPKLTVVYGLATVPTLHASATPQPFIQPLQIVGY